MKNKQTMKKEEDHNILLKVVLLVLLISGYTLRSIAQQNVITGTVLEQEGNVKEPVIGANVVFVNSQNRYVQGTTTDINGDFNLQVPDNATNMKIRFSYIGTKTQTLKYKGQSHFNIVLEDNSHTVSEVTVIGRRTDGMGISKLEQTSAVQSLKVSNIVEQSPVSSLDEALQGQIAGLDISLGGDPGARSSIRIRGTNTLTGSSDPLIVVDGVPYDTDISDDFNFSTANAEDFGALLNIPPADIESIDVLKDASATAIYGTRGANGVLLINTKRGVMGKTRFSFSSKLTAKQEPETIPLLDGDQFALLMQDELWNAANAKGVKNATNEMNMLFNSNEINYNPNYKYYDEYNANTDWLSAIKQNAYITDNNFDMTGGGEKATYRLSLGYYNESGTTVGTGLNRLFTQMKVTYNFSDRLRVNTDFSFTDTNKQANALSNARSMAMQKMPNLSPYYINDETKQSTGVYFTPESDFQGGYSSNYNPVALVNDGFNKTTSREEKMTVTLNYEFPFRLSFQGWISMNMRTTKNKQFLPQSATGVLWTSSNANRSTDATSDAFTLQSEGRFIYNNSWGKHNLIGTAVFRTYQSQSFSDSNTTYGNASIHLADPIVGSVVAGSNSGDSERRSIEVIGQAVYTYDNRYVLKATVNHSGSSAMGKNNRFGTFPAFGFAWNIDKEHFLGDKVKKWLNEAKVRLGVGWAGKAPDGAAYYYGAYQSLGRYVDMSAIYPVRMQLNKLKWQSTRELDFGVDLFLFNKLNISFDYYNKRTSDLLLGNTSLPSTTGYSTIKWLNSGVLSNRGFELRFNYQIFRNKDWTITLNNLNASRDINKVTQLPKTWKCDNYTFGNGEYALRIVEGAPVGAFYGYRYKGVYQNTKDTYARDQKGNVMNDYNGNPIVMRNGTALTYPGDAKYEDVNHDGVINENDIVYLGNANPKLIGGGGFQIRWKDLALTTFFYGRYGQKVINAARMNLESMYSTKNQSTAVLHRWKHEGDATDMPRALYGMGYNYLGSDRFVEDASFLRLKTLSISWNIPKLWLRKLRWGITRANIFATGYDLFTWTNYTGQDPEVSFPSATRLVKDTATTPVSKRYVFGITINF